MQVPSVRPDDKWSIKQQRNLVKGTDDRRRAKTAGGDHSRKANWKRWGPYLSERQWGTVREDYSAYGTAWDYFPHDHARSRAYRWGEDGLGGICDRHQFICFALALWNGKDPILKERLFGLTGNEGNHGEDVKEYYLLSRLDADAFLHEVSLQVPAARNFLRPAGRGESPARASAILSSN